LSWIAIREGDYEDARERLTPVVERTATSRAAAGWRSCCQINLAWAELGLGRPEAAIAHAVPGGIVTTETGDRSWQLESLVVAGAALVAAGAYEYGAVVLGRARVAIEAPRAAVDDYVMTVFTNAVSSAAIAGLEADMERGAGLSVAEVLDLAGSVQVRPLTL
jgi:hypothetical protein